MKYLCLDIHYLGVRPSKNLNDSFVQNNYHSVDLKLHTNVNILNSSNKNYIYVLSIILLILV